MAKGKVLVSGGNEQLEDIKRLLIFGLLKSGATQKDVAGALGIDQSVISRMFGGLLRQMAKNRKGK